MARSEKPRPDRKPHTIPLVGKLLPEIADGLSVCLDDDFAERQVTGKPDRFTVMERVKIAAFDFPKFLLGCAIDSLRKDVRYQDRRIITCDDPSGGSTYADPSTWGERGSACPGPSA